MELASIFKKNKVNQAPSSQIEFNVTQEMVNFFNAFGFLKIPKFFKDEISMIDKEFNKTMIDKFGDTSEKRNYLYPQFIDNNEKLSDLLTLPKLNKLIAALMGEDFIYKGSDGNIFSAPTPWHRDYLIRTKSCKMLIYLESNDETNGAIRMIPGTHFIDDAYSSFVGDALTWPEPPVQGGYDEKAFFGKGHNPQVFGQNQFLPQTVVQNEPGDMIIFNHNLIHCTNAAPSFRRRRLMGLHFCVNPYGSASSHLDNETREEIKTLSLVEMDSFKLDKMFGPYVYNHKSPVVQRMIAPLKGLEIKNDTSFNGLYQRQSDWSIQFCNRLKSYKYQDKKFVN